MGPGSDVPAGLPGLDCSWFEVLATAVDYVAELDLDQLGGGVYSALPVTRLPAPDQRPAFAEQIRKAVAPHEHSSEHIHVVVLAGRIR